MRLLSVVLEHCDFTVGTLRLCDWCIAIRFGAFRSWGIQAEGHSGYNLFKQLQPIPLSIYRSRLSENTAVPFLLRWKPFLMYMSSFPFPTKYPHKSMNPTASSSNICSTRTLIAILLQFLYAAPLPGKIPESIICLTLVLFSFPTNCLYLCTILVVPSLSALFVPRCTSNIDLTWPCPNVF